MKGLSRAQKELLLVRPNPDTTTPPALWRRDSAPTAATSSAGSIGFDRCISNPARNDLARSPDRGIRRECGRRDAAKHRVGKLPDVLDELKAVHFGHPKVR